MNLHIQYKNILENNDYMYLVHDVRRNYIRYEPDIVLKTTTELMRLILLTKKYHILNDFIHFYHATINFNIINITALLLACLNINHVHPETITTLLKYGADPNSVVYKNLSILMHAIKNNCNTSIIRQLVIYKADINIMFNNKNALDYACKNLNVTVEMLKLLANDGRNIKTIGKTPLIQLCKNKFVTDDLIKYLLDHYSKIGSTHINYLYKRNTALHLLCVNKKVTSNMIKLFVDYGANINVMNYYKKTPLSTLCDNLSITPDCIKLLISNENINLIDHFGNTALLIACKNVNVTSEIINLLANNITINILDRNGISALSHACKYINMTVDIVTLLANENIINMQSRSTKMTPLMYLCCAHGANIEVAKLLVTTKNIDIVDDQGHTALHLICNNSRSITIDIVSMLITNKNINAGDSNGNTPLITICINSAIQDVIRSQVIQLMLAKGCNLNITNSYGTTGLMYICRIQRNMLNVIKLLVSYGAQLNGALNSLCNNPCATVECIDFVIKKGAMCNDGVLDMICRSQNLNKIEIAKLLIENGANIKVIDKIKKNIPKKIYEAIMYSHSDILINEYMTLRCIKCKVYNSVYLVKPCGHLLYCRKCYITNTSNVCSICKVNVIGYDMLFF
jgi:ankyrin repeat protein